MLRRIQRPSLEEFFDLFGGFQPKKTFLEVWDQQIPNSYTDSTQDEDHEYAAL